MTAVLGRIALAHAVRLMTELAADPVCHVFYVAAILYYVAALDR